MMTDALKARLSDLYRAGYIGGWVPPHKNQGLGNPCLPWTIVGLEGHPSTNYYNERDLIEAIEVLEHFGPTVLTGQR